MNADAKRRKPSRALACDAEIRSERFAEYLPTPPRAMPNVLVADTAQPPTEAGALVILDQHFARGDDTGQNRHEDFFALYLVESGRGVHVINGHAYGVARGDVYITPPGTAHAYRDFDELRAVAFCFQAALFHAAELEALRATPGFWDFLTATGNAAREYSQDGFRDYRLHLSPETHALAQKQIEDIKTESAPLHESALNVARRESSLRQNASAENTRRGKGATSFDGAGPVAAKNADGGNAARRILVRALFFKLLVQLARWRDAARNENAAQRESSPRNENEAESKNETREYSRAAPDREMAALLQFCEENFDQPLTVPQLAARVFLSTARFSEVFARHTGCPPAAYLRRLRLSRAQTLLRETSLPVGEIAARCGYGEAAQLSRAFRGAFKQSPSQYRAANRHEK